MIILTDNQINSIKQLKPLTDSKFEYNKVRWAKLNPEYRKLIDFLIGLNLRENKHRIHKLVTLSGTTEERITKMKETIFG